MLAPAPERVVDLLRDGRKIEAVKIVREETGASLKDALRAVEEIEAGAREVEIAPTDPMPEVEALAREGRTVEAVQVLRQRSGLGLKEAKDVVDACPQPEAQAGVSLVRMGLLLALAALLVALGLVFLL